MHCVAARRGGSLFANRHEFSYSFKRVSTITAILEAHADGSIHLPVPVEMRRGKVKVTATLIPVSGETDQAVNTLDSLRRKNSRYWLIRSAAGRRFRCQPKPKLKEAEKSMRPTDRFVESVSRLQS
jgi:hypothetical protein